MINTFLKRLLQTLKIFSPSSGPGSQLLQLKSLESQFGHLSQLITLVSLLVSTRVTSLKLEASVSCPLVCSKSSQMEEVSVLSVKEMPWRLKMVWNLCNSVDPWRDSCTQSRTSLRLATARRVLCTWPSNPRVHTQSRSLSRWTWRQSHGPKNLLSLCQLNQLLLPSQQSLTEMLRNEVFYIKKAFWMHSFN